ncbi:MAG TPA: serine/threonine-protein kinase [Polyangiaceae bacterium]|jgi:serine/threonine-protein kinase
MGEEARSSLRKPLENAIDVELRRVERSIARAWVVLAAAATVLSLVVAATIARRLGLVMAAINAGLTVVFVGAARWVDRRPVDRRTPLVVVAFEGAMPWVFFVALAFTQGAPYALASWIPPLVFAALVVAWVARLRPWPPVVVSIASGVAYLAAYFVFVRPRVPLGPTHLILYDPPMQISRAFSLVLGGVMGAFVARQLRRAIARADSVVRSEELFGKYRIVRKLGAGASGSVHEALYCPEGGFERRVAIKQLHAALASDEALVRAFRAEAELGARLAHPNVITIHDFGRHADTFFLAMEFVDGVSLARIALRSQREGLALPTDIVAHVLRCVLRGLEHAHAARVLHRDVCPQNVLISRAGEVKLGDFGIARVLDASGEGASTRTIAGHEAYMAPEQIEGGTLAKATDLFALGVIGWELLTGRRLFVRDNPAATLLAVTRAPVAAVSMIRPELGPAWDDFISRALERPIDRRFGSARAMLDALDAFEPVHSETDAALGALAVRFASGEDTSKRLVDDEATMREAPPRDASIET